VPAHPKSRTSELVTPSRKPHVPASPTSAFLAGRSGSAIVDAAPMGADRLLELDAPGETDVALFVRKYSERLERMLAEIGMVESGERILAVGEGWWLARLEVLLLTDSRLIFGHSFGVSSSHWVGGNQPGSDGDDERTLQLREGKLIIADYSPFRAVEVRRLIASPDSAERFVELEPLVESAPELGSDEPSEHDSGTLASLERLDVLRRNGAIDDNEFAELKRQLIWGNDNPPEASG
jgi:hypothetical protein